MEGSSRNMYKRLMDKAKGDRIEGGKWRMGENGDNCTYNTIKKINTI